MKQLIHYGLVGLASNGAAFLVYVVVTGFGASPKATSALIYVVAATLSFFGNRSLTFAHTGRAWGAGVRFVIAHGIGLGINMVLLVVLIDWQGFSHVWSQAFAIVVVAVYLFVTLKYFVFAKEPDAISG